MVRTAHTLHPVTEPVQISRHTTCFSLQNLAAILDDLGPPERHLARPIKTYALSSTKMELCKITSYLNVQCQALRQVCNCHVIILLFYTATTWDTTKLRVNTNARSHTQHDRDEEFCDHIFLTTRYSKEGTWQCQQQSTHNNTSLKKHHVSSLAHNLYV